GEEALGSRGSRPLVKVEPGVGVEPVVTVPTPAAPVPKVEEPKPIQEARARPYEAPRLTGKDMAGKDGAPMALVPAGEFLMGNNDGDSDERPAHSVHLDAFFMDKFEVTTSRYGKYVQATGRPAPPYWNQMAHVSDGDRPVIGIDWHDADAYCRHYGKRLPTEAEWEKAARGTDGRKYPWGNAEPTPSLTNFGKRLNANLNYYNDRLTPVGSLGDGKSPYGIFDLSGNVMEWVADWYGDGYYQQSPARNPTGPSNGTKKVMRGGSWINDALYLRSSYRYRYAPINRDANFGFRCAMDAPT
ncbi:MAG: SUMF1/EgtB/PvdO family nonheme iron enzyme, partial [Nitrospirota bacterium]|nr:SUMF1/EgtB/PvdO family nonheme iron enzyme [Nitrospirota bacterium]